MLWANYSTKVARTGLGLRKGPQAHGIEAYQPSSMNLASIPSLDPRLTADRGRAGVGIACRSRPVQLKENARVCGRVGTRERDEVARLQRPRAPGDGELSTSDVKLSTSHCGGAVQGDMLHTEQVVTVCDALGNGDADLRLACTAPS